MKKDSRKKKKDFRLVFNIKTLNIMSDHSGIKCKLLSSRLLNGNLEMHKVIKVICYYNSTRGITE